MSLTVRRHPAERPADRPLSVGSPRANSIYIQLSATDQLSVRHPTVRMVDDQPAVQHDRLVAGRRAEDVGEEGVVAAADLAEYLGLVGRLDRLRGQCRPGVAGLLG